MNDALSFVIDIKMGDTEIDAVLAQRLDKDSPRWVTVVATRRSSGQNMIYHCKSQLGAVHLDATFSQAFKGMLAGDFVNHVPINVQQKSAITQVCNDVLVPNFVKEGAWDQWHVVFEGCSARADCRDG
jgi:hypothetical protein